MTHWRLLCHIGGPVKLEGGSPDADVHIGKGLQGAALPLTVLLGPPDSLPPFDSCLTRQPQPSPLGHCFETILLPRHKAVTSLSVLAFSFHKLWTSVCSVLHIWHYQQGNAC